MEILERFWPYVVALTGIGSAIAVTIHAVLGRRDTGTIIGWIGLAWLVPIFGPLIYYGFGINRIRRRAALLKVRGGRSLSASARMREEDYRIRDDILEASPGMRGLVTLGSNLTGRPVLPGNAIEPLVNGDEAFPAMLAAIGSAERSLSFCTYIFDCDPVGEEFLEALKAARARGVEVRVLIDHVGSRYSHPTMVHRMREEGIPVAPFLPTRRFFPYTNLRNHRKILVADGHLGFTGGANIRLGHCLDRDPPVPVQDLHFEVRGPVVVDLQRTFAIDWAFTTGEALDGEAWFPGLGRAGTVAARGIPDGPDEDLDHMVEVILGALSVASRSVRIATPYFLPDSPILRALSITALRGVDVDILIPEKSNIPFMTWATRANFEALLEKGCRLHYAPPPFDHTKIMTVDDVWSLIGSTNWDVRSLRLNFEFNLECYGRGLAQRLNALFEERRASGWEVTLDEVRARSLPVRLRDGLARLGTPYL